MAKKEELKSGFGKRIKEGTPSGPAPSRETAETTKVVEQNAEHRRLSATHMKRLQEGRRNASSGAPAAKSTYLQTSLALDINLYDKIRQIADVNGLPYRDILNAALELFIELYDNKHGPIEPAQESKKSARSLI